MRPVFSARVEYSNLTSDGSVRHGVFRGLREVELTPQAAPARKRLISEADLATVWVTNPTRRLFGRSGPTKLDVAVYYAAVGDFMLPHLFGRPVSLVRCPTGKPEDCFFQRHRFLGMPRGARQLRDPDQRRGGPDLSHRRDAARLPGAGAVRRGRVPHLGLPGGRASNGPTGWSSTSTPARGSRGARWSRRRCMCGASWRRWGSRASPRPPAARGCTWWCR